MDKFINRWMLEFAPTCVETFDDEATAMKRQDELAATGYASQLYHERYMLMKEPMRWVNGK